VLKNRFRDDILGETCQQLLPKYFSEAAEEEGLKLVDAPTYDDIDHERDQPLRFSATFEIYPSLDITNYTGIPVEAVPDEVTDEEFDAAMDRLLEEHSEMQPVEEDRPVEAGDFVEITFTGTLGGGDGEEGETLTGEKALCEIGGETTVAEFTDNLTGARAGEDRAFEVRYRDDHPDKRLAGKAVSYQVHLESLERKHRPEPDDEFAGSIGDYKTIADLRTAVRNDLERHKTDHAKQRTRDSLLGWLGAHNEFEVPEVLVEHQLEARLQNLMQDLYRRGVDPRGLSVDWGRIRQDQYENAVRDVRGSLILDHLAEKENISVTDAELDERISQMAADMNQPEARVREVLARDDGAERIRRQIRNDRLFGFLEEQASIRPAGSLSGDADAAGIQTGA
jgi:trigger factor